MKLHFCSRWAALTVLLLCAAVLLACAGDGDGVTGQAWLDETVSDTVEVPLATAPTLVADGEAQYVVILPERSNGAIRDAVSVFCDQLSDLYGAKFSTKTSRKGLADGQRVILIGAQADGSAMLDGLAYNAYRVQVSETGDIVVGAWSSSAISEACGKLILRCRKAVEQGDTVGTVTEALAFTGTDADLLDVELPQLSAVRMPWIYHIQGTKGAYELCFKESAVQDWTNYLQKLADAGYALVQRRENDDACFAVCQKGDVQITVDFFRATGELLILADQVSTAVPLTAEPVTEAVTPKLIAVGCAFEGALKGMTYLLQASDGSFVMIDGGEGEEGLLEQLYALMTANLPEGTRPHIRAWIITHQHSDHIGGIVNFAASQYAALVDCDAVYTNMPYSKYQTAYTNYDVRYAKVEKAAGQLGADFIIARTGQTYYFGDLGVCILGTVDDMLLTDYNDLDETSLVFSIRTAAKKMLFSGDAGGFYFGQYLLKRYTAATLKCDICQASSHGQNNDTAKPYYQMADPDIYLWPATLDFYGRHTPNKYIEKDTSARILYAYNGTETIDLK